MPSSTRRRVSSRSFASDGVASSSASGSVYEALVDARDVVVVVVAVARDDGRRRMWTWTWTLGTRETSRETSRVDAGGRRARADDAARRARALGRDDDDDDAGRAARRRRRRRRRADARRVVARAACVAAAMATRSASAFGPRPRPRLYEKPKLPRRLLEAELALGELAPGGPAAAGLLGDGRWRASAGGDDEEGDGEARTRATRRVRFEEYALRGATGTARAGVERDSRRDASTSASASHAYAYTAEIRPGGGDAKARVGVVPADSMDSMAATTTTPDGGDSVARGRDGDASGTAARAADSAIEALVEELNSKSPAQEMFEMLRREGEHFVNPRTGKKFEWGDTWMHERGGGVGTGRPESRPRRLTADGAVEVMPAKGDAGYALVPMSSDKQGLLEFYDRCNGPRWSNTRNWGVGEPCANAWHGVVCVGGRVTELLMNLNNVACMGSLNVTALATHVHELRYIDLSDNLFTGDLPRDLFKMTQLQSLVLSGNRITGALPEDVGALTNLRHIDLSANAMRGALPESLGALSELKVLYLGESGLENKNDFAGPIPESWRRLKSLKSFSLAGNSNIGGTLPDWLLNNLDSLEELTLSRCGLTGEIPPNVDQMKSLRVLDLGENSFSGVVPVESLSRLRRLKHLRLAGNALIGSLGPSVAHLREIETFDVSSNRLTGDLPKELFSLRLLEILDVSNNAFTGTLAPPDGAETSNLRVVDAESNRLVGVLLDGEFFKRAPHLRYLRLSNNRISGAFTDGAFDDAGELVELHASNNDLLGPLPDSVRHLTKLKSLRLSGNARLGAGRGIPDALSECWNLRVVELARAGFEGDIADDAFARMRRLSSLNLAENKFSGNVPASLKSAEFLRKLEIQNNAFVGEIPSWLVELPHLELADFTGNKFTGAIPDSFYDPKTNSVPKLEEHRNRPAGVARVLRLGRNPLFCPLPPWARAAVGATCVRTEITSIDPATGAASGGAVVTLRGSGIPGARDVGCFFGTEAEHVFVRATSFTKSHVACVAPSVADLPKPPERNAAGYAVSVRVGTSASGAATEFGELFVYTTN